MTGLEPYAVDLDQVLETIAVLARSGADVDEVLHDVRRRVGTLHETWDGVAAGAQLVAQAEWESGCASMREALGRMRDAAEVAHDNYAAAGETNVTMWSSLW